MTFELGRSLLLADAIAPDALASALFMVATKGVSLPRALLAMEAVEAARLEEELARAQVPVLRHVVPLPELVDRLPPGLCEALLAVPLRRDPRTGTIDVAVVDARDAHAADEIAYWLEAPVRVLRTSFAAMDAALRKMKAGPERGVQPLAPPIWVPVAQRVREVAETPMYGTPIVDEREVQAAVARAATSDREIPIPLTKKADPLPEPVLDLTNPKVPSSAPRSSPLSSAPPPTYSAARILAEEPTSSPAPPTARGPFAQSAPAPPFADLDEILAEMRSAKTRDRVLELLVAGTRTVARKVALFVVKQGAFVGWACTPELGDVEALRRVRIPLVAPTVLARALDGAAALGTLLDVDVHGPLLRAMKSPPGEVATAAVRIDGKPALVVLADELGDTMIATRRLEELTTAAADALTRILIDRRR